MRPNKQARQDLLIRVTAKVKVWASVWRLWKQVGAYSFISASTGSVLILSLPE